MAAAGAAPIANAKSRAARSDVILRNVIPPSRAGGRGLAARSRNCIDSTTIGHPISPHRKSNTGTMSPTAKLATVIACAHDRADDSVLPTAGWAAATRR